MAETIGALILTAAGASDIAGIAGLGSIAGTTIAGTSLATVIGTTAILATTIGLNYALNKPGIPKPEDGSQALKTAIPPRIRGYGTNRLAGYYMLFEAAGPAPATSYDVIALHSGRITKFDRFLLSDDPVNVSGDISLGGGPVTVTAGFTDGRYSMGAIKIEARLGAASQSSLIMMATPIISGVWTSQFQGNGIAYLGMSCDSGTDPKLYTQVYPRGRPELSAICDCSPCWDPRDGAQDRHDETTWLYTSNPVIELLDFLTRADGGMGLDLDTILPPTQLAAWMGEADICDTAVATASAGVEKRYESHGWFRFDNNPEDVIGGILSTCDGHLAESGDGTLSLTVGLYRAPTAPPITEKHIFGFSLNYGQPDEQIVNQLDISFTDPGSLYVAVQADPWRDEDSISLTGIVRAQPIDLKWVHSLGQARRLADRAMQRLNPLMTGSFTTNLYGLRYLGQRWVSLQYPFVSGLQACVVEIQDAEVDILAGKIIWQFIRIQPDTIEAYNPAIDEGAPPVIPPPVTHRISLDFQVAGNSQYIPLLEDI
jgi:hypothetical protein